MMKNNKVGLGNPQGNIQVYIENIPPLAQYQNLSNCRALAEGEIAQIAQLTGNHWRKVFNVYAKFAFELNLNKEKSHFKTWQEFREQSLLQKSSNEMLWFSKPTHKQLSRLGTIIHIIMGKQYANKLNFAHQCQWLSPSFAINESHNMIICPYFDYRQLSNVKITQLCQLVKQLNE